MKLHHCPDCNEDKPRKAFNDARGRKGAECAACRRTKYARARYHQEKIKWEEHLHEMNLKLAKQTRREQILRDKGHAQLRLIKKEIAVAKSLSNKFRKKLLVGAGTSRTDQALIRANNKLALCREAQDLIVRDIQLGINPPEDLYLTNTYLLNKYDFPCKVVHTDPWGV